MRFRFLHCADVHLGRHRHGNVERYGDYFTALGAVVEHALRERVNAVLIAGDLFDEQRPSAETLLRAMSTLRPLREAGIPAFAIEGNHDRRTRGERFGALDVLDAEGYLVLLRPESGDDGLLLPDWAPGHGGAVYRASTEVAIVGLGFLAHSIEEQLAAAAAQLPSERVVIALAHVMVLRGESELEYGCVREEQLDVLRDRVRYLALGHRHTRRGLDEEADGWVFNPGSLEFVNPLDYHLPPELRGFLDVTIGEGEPPEEKGKLQRHEDVFVHARHVPTAKRPAHTVRVALDGCTTPDAVIEQVLHVAAEQLLIDNDAPRPIIIVRLTGNPALSRSRIPRAAIAERLREQLDALHVEVLDRDLEQDVSMELLLIDERDLEHVTDRARAIAAELLRGAGMAHGREADLAATLLDVKAALDGSGRSASQAQFGRMRDMLRPFVEYDEEDTA